MKKLEKFPFILQVLFLIGCLSYGHIFRAEAFWLPKERDFRNSAISNQANQDQTDWELPASYGQSSWPTIHRDGRNSDYLPYVTTAQLTLKWHALEDEYSAVLTAAVLGPEGNVYFTTGKDEKYGNLHAFDRQGNELWRSYLLDNGALCSAPLIDREGDIYLGDSDEFYSFHPDGSLKWHYSEIKGPFVSTALSLEGYIIAINLDGLIYLFDPKDGHLVASPIELPGWSPGESYRIFTPPGLWQGMVQSNTHLTAAEIFNGLLGYQFKITNTPAVNPVNGRIYIAGTIKSPTPPIIQGRFYGVDIIPDGSRAGRKLQLTFQTEMGPGSGSSPAISPDGSHIYTLDNEGTLYAFNSEGEKAWSIPIKAKPASPTIGPDGTIYGISGSQLYALVDSGNLAKVAWQKDFTEDIVNRLVNIISLPSWFENLPLQILKPTIQCNSVVSASKNYLYFTLAYGYERINQDSNLATFLPMRYFLAVLTPPGRLKKTQPIIRNIIEIPDTSDSVITLDKDGTIFCTHGSISSSIAYSIGKKLGFNPRKPTGGVTVLGPENQKELLRSQINWIRDSLNASLQALRNGNIEQAYVRLGDPVEQLQAIENSLRKGLDNNEIGQEEAGKAKDSLAKIYSQILAAQDILKNETGNNQKKQSNITSRARMYLRSASQACRYLKRCF